MKSIEIIKNLVNLVGFTAGIILLSIGAVTLINKALQIYVFDIDKNSYYDAYVCDKYDYDSIKYNKLLYPSPVETIKVKIDLTEKEKQELDKKYKECLVKDEKKEEERYGMESKRDISFGASFFLVGLFLVLFYYRLVRRRD